MQQPICPVCGDAIARRGSRGPLPTYCSKRCQSRATYLRSKAAHPSTPKPKVLTARTCAHCGEEFTASGRTIYCAKNCARRAARARQTKTCSIDGCDGKFVAKGMCGTHYSRATLSKEKRHKRVSVPCVVCGAKVSRREDDRYRHVCSTACRTILVAGTSGGSDAYDWASEAVNRAKRHGAKVVESFDRIEIFERDSWTCYMCGEVCDKTADTCNPMSATVDHVVALSNGGDHSRANARTACLGCNSSKAARDRAAA